METESPRSVIKLVFAALSATAMSGAVAQDNSFLSAIKATKPIVDARLRMERVDQTPLSEDAEADTFRLRAGFETGKVWQTSLLAEGEFVTPFASDYRADGAVARDTQYPVVPDPENYELNRLHLTNSSLPGTTLTLGRQRILLDDNRFVGNVGWRQNEQTFDAVRAINKSVKALTIDATYLNRVNRIFGENSPQGDYKGDGFLGNVAYQFPVGKLTGFGYVLDFEPLTNFPGLTAAQAAGLNPVRVSTETYGARFAGEKLLGKFKLGYVTSYAQQGEYGSNPATFDLDYYTVELTGGYAAFSLVAGQEVLEGNGTVGFSTPLATLHRFNGWADKFLTTPANGIDDRYIGLGYAAKNLGVFDTVSANVFYHDYESERLAQDLGNEVNVQLQAKVKRFTGLIKYATYAAEEGRTPVAYQDTSKFWVQVEYAW